MGSVLPWVLGSITIAIGRAEKCAWETGIPGGEMNGEVIGVLNGEMNGAAADGMMARIR